jgi:hypothetical protein
VAVKAELGAYLNVPDVHIRAVDHDVDEALPPALLLLLVVPLAFGKREMLPAGSS